MVAIPECEAQSLMRHAFAIAQPGNDCVRQLAAATRELGAFIRAVGKLSGEEAASNAAQYWVALAESSLELPSTNGFPGWRHITILAANRLARTIAPPAVQKL
jgi:hypothetical protein